MFGSRIKTKGSTVQIQRLMMPVVFMLICVLLAGCISAMPVKLGQDPGPVTGNPRDGDNDPNHPGGPGDDDHDGDDNENGDDDPRDGDQDGDEPGDDEQGDTDSDDDGNRGEFSSSITLFVTHGNDLGWRNTSYGNLEIISGGTSGHFWFGGARNDYDSDAFFRWRGVNIPANAKIKKAAVRVMHVYDGDPLVNEAPVVIKISGFAYDDAPIFDPFFSDPSELDTLEIERTDAHIEWEITDRWMARDGQWYETEDISAIIQEIIDRPGWKPGNAIGVAFDSQPHANRYHRSICPFNNGPFNNGACDKDKTSPVLYIEFTVDNI